MSLEISKHITFMQPIKSLSISKINLNEIKLKTLRKDKSVPITHQGKLLTFHTPFINISEAALQKTKFPNISQLDTLFDDKVMPFHKFIEALENKISQEVRKQGSSWFTEKNVGLRSLVKKIDQQKKDSGIENECINWPIDMVHCEFVDENGEEAEPEFDNVMVRILVDVPHIWINRNLFGLAVIVRMVMIRSNEEPQKVKYVFGSESETEDLSQIHSMLSNTEHSSEQVNKKSPQEVPEKVPNKEVPEKESKKKKSSKKNVKVEPAVRVELVKNKKHRKKKVSTESESESETESESSDSDTVELSDSDEE